MSAIEIRGLRPLKGEIIVQGSKNAVLPMMAASVLNRGKTLLNNVPRIQDVFCMMGILNSLGCTCRLKGHQLEIDSSGLSGSCVLKEDMQKMRSSIMLLGALLGRCGEAGVYSPGGCMIGERPIDLHLMALRELGAEIGEDDGDGVLYARVRRFTGKRIVFPFPSVGATENALFAAVMATGRTVLEGCAREPEIGELCSFLNSMGACVRGQGTDILTVEGGLPLHDTHFTVGGDRIVAGTYLMAAAAARGELVLTGLDPGVLGAVTDILKKMGAVIYEDEGLLYIRCQERLLAADICTGPYPDFPTDLQSVMMAVMSLSKGESRIQETVFENRFRTAAELEKMGARIECMDDKARIKGREMLFGTRVEARDLRGGAALAVAALAAEGSTIIGGYEHIQRGYEDICRDLEEIGADIHMCA